jgi:hypothetical protein
MCLHLYSGICDNLFFSMLTFAHCDADRALQITEIFYNWLGFRKRKGGQINADRLFFLLHFQFSLIRRDANE